MPKMAYNDKRVLIIDDQRPFLILLRGLLNSLGAKSVVIAPNGESAIADCKRESFDLIICDLHLGADKKNGFQFLEEIRLKKLVKADTVFIMVSGDAERPMVLGSLEKQPDGYIVKPFSQAQLSLRLSRAYEKKQALKPVYIEIQKGNIPQAIDACRTIILGGTRFMPSCCRLLAELYWLNGQYLEAKHMLAPILEAKPSPWINVSMAQTQYLLSNYEEAISLVTEVLKTNKLMVEAQDILAQSYFKLGKTENAMLAINRALHLSPLSIERQIKASSIARANNDFFMIKCCSLQVWEQSKKSIHRDIAHLCSYFRSILDAAEHSKDSVDRNKYQQEALHALQRYRQDDDISRMAEDFNYDIFEELLNARMSFLDGKLSEAKSTLTKSQAMMHSKYHQYPLTMAPDSIKVMLDLGEFDDADKLNNKLLKSGKVLDKNTRVSLSAYAANNKNKKEAYTKYNKLGIELYGEGKYQAAYEAFSSAQVVAPVNTGIALNLLQCNLRILEKSSKPNIETITSCRKTYRHVRSMVMLDAHQLKFNTLRADLKKYVEV